MSVQQYLRSTLSRLFVSVALLCATLAWFGWVFLHSVGDPHHFERIAMSILDSPEARDEVALQFSDQLVDNIPIDPAQKAAVTVAISDVLGDPRIVGNFVDAFGSAQANALGIDDPRPTVIDVGALVEVVREDLARTQPELAASIPISDTKVEIPRIQSTVLADLRRLAETWTLWLALIAVFGLVSLMIFGDRRVVLRSFGFWAIATGAFWAIGPRVAPWFAQQFAPRADALTKATIDAVAGPITTAATLLFVLGIVAFVVRALFFGAAVRRFGRDRRLIVDDYGQQSHSHAPAGAYVAQPPPPPVASWHTAPAPVGQTPWPTAPTHQVVATNQGVATNNGVATNTVVAAHQPGRAGLAQPAPILLRPLDLPTSSDSLSSLSDGDEHNRR